MPISKKRYNKRYKSKKAPLYKKIQNVDRKVKRIMSREELKYFDADVTASAINEIGNAYCLNEISAVTFSAPTVQSRIGNEIIMTSCQGRLYFNLSTIPHVCRVLVFIDRQPDGAISVGDLFTGNIPSISPYRRSYNKRFKILYDKTRYLPVHGAGSTVPGPNYFQFNVKMGHRVKYLNDGPDATDIATNALWFVVLSNAPALDTTVTMYGQFRTYFKDT